MFCTVCGTAFRPDTRFCANCGAELTPGAGVAKPAEDGAWRFEFHGDGAALLVLYVKTFLLTLVTLGIYWFWGRAAIRRYLYESTRFAGAPPRWHGTGFETFKGTLIVLAAYAGILFSPALAISLIPGMKNDSAALIMGLVWLAVVLAALPWAIVGSLRYRSSRSEYRGLRFGFRGGILDCAMTFGAGLLLTLLTLGIYYPFFLSKWYRYRMLNLRFGNTPFQYDGEDGALFGQFLISALLFPVTFGISWFWWLAAKERYYRGHTTLQGLRFESRIDGGTLAFISITNWLLTLITLGIYYPFGQVRLIRYYLDSTSAAGRLDWALLQAQAADPMLVGEGAAILFELDVDAGFIGGGF